MPRNKLQVRAPRWSEDWPRQSSRISSDESNRDRSAVAVFCVCGLVSSVGLIATIYAAYQFPSFGAVLALLGQY